MTEDIIFLTVLGAFTLTLMVLVALIGVSDYNTKPAKMVQFLTGLMIGPVAILGFGTTFTIMDIVYENDIYTFIAFVVGITLTACSLVGWLYAGQRVATKLDNR
jgi:hypothetical protein